MNTTTNDHLPTCGHTGTREWPRTSSQPAHDCT